ncbi:hypothetical protein [Clostridium sp.]|uniref:hypothetical protein n=1 Tax=Clostridium sp. TaxID=1506 RepID=UPI003D6CAE97
MKILIFLHGTVIMHKNGLGKTREQRVQQVINNDPSLYDFISYIPIGTSDRKLGIWKKQGAEIIYLSSNKNLEDIKKDMFILKKYGFPKEQILFREGNLSYKDIAENIIPDILIEDDCESIGGRIQMVYPNISYSVKNKIKSIIVKEFSGIDNLPSDINELRYL